MIEHIAGLIVAWVHEAQAYRSEKDCYLRTLPYFVKVSSFCTEHLVG